MKLITELVEDLDIVTEADSNGKESLFIEGIFLQAEQKNRNGRVYPLEILEREVRRYKKDYVKQNRAFGELGHPDGPAINLERVSHMITELRKSDTDFVGKAKVLNSTPYGKIVEGLLKDGAKLGVSSRGMGSLDETQKGTKIVKDDFYLATAADIVADPSAPHAFVQGVMEGREWIYENSMFREVDLDSIKKTIDSSSRREREQEILHVFETFVSKL
tara:strand:- start:188 stop:841 length:654 start_codon:yes stop_codon:yes gene_type:complete